MLLELCERCPRQVSLEQDQMGTGAFFAVLLPNCYPISVSRLLREFRRQPEPAEAIAMLFGKRQKVGGLLCGLA
jgi:hypothetical protein